MSSVTGKTDARDAAAQASPPEGPRGARVCSTCGRRALAGACAKCGGAAVFQCLACAQPIGSCEVLITEVKRAMELAVAPASEPTSTAEATPAGEPTTAVATPPASPASAFA